MQENNSSSLEARRRFLATCGKFAAVTPPTITLMLAAAERSYVAAQSGGGGGGNGNGNGPGPLGNNGFGNGGGDGSPNGFEDTNR
jgi:hypothetical protein